MAITTIQLVDTDLSTTLFDLHSADGTTNSAWGSVITKFGLGGSFTVTAPLDAERFEHPGIDGAFTTFSRRGLGAASWRQGIAGTTEANLRLGVGRLTDLLTRGTILRIVTSTTTRYLRIEPSDYPSPYQGKELELHDIFQAFSFRQGLDISAACQPYWEGAEVSVAGVTVPNDPATSTKARVYPLTVTGDLPTPGKVRVQMDTGATVERVKLGLRSQGNRPSTYMSTYLSDTAFMQCEATGRGWTIALGTDTTAVDPTEDGSPGSGSSVARVASAGGSVAVMTRRVRGTRTTNVDSLRGTHDIILRCKASAAARWVIEGRWGPSTADPVAFSLGEVVFDTSVNGTPSTFGYVELTLGTFHIPEASTVAVSGLAVEVWARRESGAGDLDLDFTWHPPSAPQGTVVVPVGSRSVFDGADLATPVSNPAGGTAGTVVGTALLLDTTTDNAGVAPNTGTVLAAGRYRVTFEFEGLGTATTSTVKVRNITGSADAASKLLIVAYGQIKRAVVEFDADGTSAYQEQVDDPNFASMVRIRTITREYLQPLGLNESCRTDPSRPAVERLDSSGNVAGYLDIQGAVPVLLVPGLNHLCTSSLEIPIPLYEQNQSKLARTPTVSVIYMPRYAL